MEEKYNVGLLAAGMHREAQLLIAEVGFSLWFLSFNEFKYNYYFYFIFVLGRRFGMGILQVGSVRSTFS